VRIELQTRGNGETPTRRHGDAATRRQDGWRLSKPARFWHMFCGWSQVAILVLAIVCLGSSLEAQTKKKTPGKSQPKSQTTLDTRLAQAKADLVSAANDYKESLQKLLAFEEDDVKLATATLEKRKALFAENIIGSREVEESVRALDDAKVRVRTTLMTLAEAELFSKSGANQANDYSSTKAPYGREVLLRVLGLNALPMREVEGAVETRGVSFHLTPEDEAEFSSLGATRGLLRIIVSNYRNR
jgi:hypothetical protein